MPCIKFSYHNKDNLMLKIHVQNPEINIINTRVSFDPRPSPRVRRRTCVWDGETLFTICWLKLVGRESNDAWNTKAKQ